MLNTRSPHAPAANLAEGAGWHTEVARQYLSDLSDALSKMDHSALGRIAAAVMRALSRGKTVYLAGNGGSATAACHMASDWSAAAMAAGLRPSVISLSDNTARITALGNDVGYDEIFARQLEPLGRPGDLLVLLSVSGSSPNLVRAAQVAEQLGMERVGLLGRAGSVTALCTDWALLGQSDYGLAEDLHVSVNHIVVRSLRGGTAQCCDSPEAPVALPERSN